MGQQGGRYDAQIRSRVAQVIAGNKDYKNVKADVEDGIVTLSGELSCIACAAAWLLASIALPTSWE
jgi:osmotically-inducible protein OsmY